MSEPVEYQYRTRPDWIPGWNGWNTCSKESAEAYEKTPYLHDWHYEVRRLYTTPTAQQKPVAFLVDGDLYYPEEIDWETLQEQGHTVAPLYTSPQAPRTWVGLTDEEIQTEWVLTPQNDRAEGIWFGRRIEAKLKEKNQ